MKMVSLSMGKEANMEMVNLGMEKGVNLNIEIFNFEVEIPKILHYNQEKSTPF